MPSIDSFKTRQDLSVGRKKYAYYSLPAAEEAGLTGISRLPRSMKVLLENLLRNEDGVSVTEDDLKAVAAWVENKGSVEHEIAFRPARVLMQDFTGVPAVVDLAAMRDAMSALGGDAAKINPLVPVDLVIDHSVMVDNFGTSKAFGQNVEREYERNIERYRFLRWGSSAFNNFRVVPPGTGICHQVNLENLAQTVWTLDEGKGETVAYPDTVVGTDSHTTMINGLAVLGWGVGGIEAEAAMLGQPIPMLIPEVIGFKLTGFDAGRHDRDRPGADRHPDAAQEGRGRQVRRILRRRPAEHDDRGPGDHRQHGPGIRRHLRLLPRLGRHHRLSDRHRPRQGARRAGRGLCQGEQGLWIDETGDGSDPVFTDTLELDLGSTVVPSMAGPKRPQDRVALDRHAAPAFAEPPWTGTSSARSRSDFRPARMRSKATVHDLGQRRRGHRRHHLLHQHLQPIGADRRRPAGPQDRCARGLKVPSHGSRPRWRPDRRSSPTIWTKAGLQKDAGRPGLQPGRLWLHHLHRQLRPAGRQPISKAINDNGSGRDRRAVGQPQLRRPREPRRPGQLPGLARRWSSPTPSPAR